VLRLGHEERWDVRGYQRSSHSLVVPGHHHTAAQGDHRRLELVGHSHHAVSVELLHDDHIKASRTPEDLLQCFRTERQVACLFAPVVQQEELLEVTVECALLEKLKEE